MSEAPRVVVIGGGITGAFAAYYSAQLGAETFLVERDPTGTNASSNNPGGLNPMHGNGIPGPLAGLALESYWLHRDEWPRIDPAGPASFAGRVVSRLEVALDQTSADRLAARASEPVPDAALSRRWLSASEVRRLEPLLHKDVVGALHSQGNLRVEPARYTAAVTAAGAGLGVTRIAAEVTGLRRVGSTVTAVECGDDVLGCDAVIIATGPWCSSSAAWLDLQIPVAPLRGELVLVDVALTTPDLDIGCGTTGIYPVSMTQAWLGGTEDEAGFDATASASGADRIAGAAARLVPSLASARVVGHRVGLRPITPDGLPVVGRAPGWDNVALALGSGRKGMLLATGVGRACAELVIRGVTDLSVSELGLDRPGLAA